MNREFATSMKEIEVGRKVRIRHCDYEISDIKHGGMGTVLILKKVSGDFDIIFRSIIAAKILKSFSQSSESEEMFFRELNIWISFDHVNIVPLRLIEKIYDKYWAIMPAYGSNLRDILPRHVHDLSFVRETLMQIIDALEYVYNSFHLIHMDIKPENILCDKVQTFKMSVSDWGLASIQHHLYTRCATQRETTDSINQTFHAFGTLPYMAPERLTGRKPSVHFDIYSLGIMAFELLFGITPFTDLSTQALYRQILDYDYYDFAKYAMFKSPYKTYSNIILNCIEPDPYKRYSTYRDLKKDLSMNILSKLLSKFM